MSIRRKLAKHNITVLHGRMDGPHLRSGTLNAVVDFEHVSRVQGARTIMEDVRQSLVPGGRVVIVDRWKQEALLPGTGSQDHWISPEQIDADLSQTGFTIDSRRNEFIRSDPNGEPWWMIVAHRPGRCGIGRLDRIRTMPDETRQRTPEELLAEIELEERRKQRGRLKVFLGYASGVGKSFQMLDEGRRRYQRGEDVVACALQPNYPPDIQLIVDQLEIIPTTVTACGEAIDLPSVIRRRPEVAMIDGLAYDNPPECRNAHRWQDVEQLLSAGISVLTTVNIQYLQNLQDEVERITGKRTPYIIPREFLNNSADEVTVVDAPSEESVLGGIEGSSARLAEKHKLSRLRELALLVAASVVDRQLESYLRSQGTEQTWGVQERILVCVTAESDASEILESGRRNADRFQGEFYVLQLSEERVSPEEQECLARNLDYARGLGAKVHTVTASDPVTAILRFATQRGVTQIFAGRRLSRPDFRTRLRGSLAVRLIRAAEGIDVVIYPHR